MKKWTKEEIEITNSLIKLGKNYKDISIILGRTKNSVKMYFYKTNQKLIIFKSPKQGKSCKRCSLLFYTKELDQIYCSHSCANITIGLSKKKRNACKQCSQDCKSKYCSKSCHHDYEMMHKITTNSASAQTIKRYLLQKDKSCSVCTNSKWNNKSIPLELDHIDGNSSNNIIENLRLLCPNCHAQTDTYKGKNVGNGRHKRLQRYHDGKSY